MTTATMGAMELVAPDMAIEGICHLAREYETYIMQGQPQHLAHVIDDIDAFTGDVYVQEDRHKIGESSSYQEFWIEIPAGNSGSYELMLNGCISGGEILWDRFRLIYESIGDEIPIAVGYQHKKTLFEFAKAVLQLQGELA